MTLHGAKANGAGTVFVNGLSIGQGCEFGMYFVQQGIRTFVEECFIYFVVTLLWGSGCDIGEIVCVDVG